MADIELIKSRLDIVEIIGNRIELKRAGANYKALCPFHQEKSPSFMVNPNLQIYKCFGCGKKGDLINFLEDYERIEFREALRMAAEMAGVEIDDSHYAKNPELEAKKKRNLEANEIAAKLYNYILKTHKLGKPGREYAAKRHLGAKEIEKFMFGYATGAYENLKSVLLKRGFTEKELIEFGLLVERNGKTVDKFRNRLMQPVRNTKGEIVGFSGRYIGTSDAAPKYLNSPETPVFKKNELIYGLFEAQQETRNKKFIILVEGNLDVVSSHRAGVENTACPLGTAFTENQAKLLKRYADEIFFCFDKDTAGINALVRSIKILEDLQIQHRVIDIGKYKDPDELVSNEPDLWVKVINENQNTFEYLIDKFKQDYDLGTADGKFKFKNKILPVIQFIKDDVVRSHFLKEISILLEVTQDELKSSIGNIKSQQTKLKMQDSSLNAASEKIKTFNDHRDSRSRYLLSIIIQNPNLDVTFIDPLVFENENYIRIFNLIAKDTKPEDFDIELQNTYAELSLQDISSIDDIKQETKKTYYWLFREFLKDESMRLRKLLAVNEDDLEALRRFNAINKEINRVEKILKGS